MLHVFIVILLEDAAPHREVLLRRRLCRSKRNERINIVTRQSMFTVTSWKRLCICSSINAAGLGGSVGCSSDW